MGRIRTIKPEFWKHEILSSLPESTHILAAALLNYADDEGYFNANPGLIKAECFPLRESSVSVQDSLKSLSSIGYLCLGDGPDGRRYGCIINFTEHQRINRATESKIKPLSVKWEFSHPSHAQLTEDSPLEGKGKEGKGKGSKSPSIGPDMVAMAVRTELSLGGNAILMTLEDVCKAEIAKGANPEQIRDALIKAYREYEIAKPRLEYSKGATKFFAEGDWRNPSGWPWRRGEQPASVAPKPITLAEKMERQMAQA